MTTTTTLTGLDDVRALLAESDPQGRLVACDLRDLIVGPGVLGHVVSAVADVAPAPVDRHRSVAVIVDETPIWRSPSDSTRQDVKAEVVRLLSVDSDVAATVLSDGHSELHVTEPVVESARRACEGADVIVAVGGGTISDIGKLVAAVMPGVPVISVMTAASVDGYTDNVSVTLRDGVKRTVPSVWPDVVIADAETVAGAPSRMNRAGYGEMTSMYVAPADWRLASLVGVDSTFHRGPIALLEALSSDLDACAPGVAAGDPLAVQQLTWALALRGIATGVAGSTACLSGVEHLVSHMLDLRAAQLDLPTGLHGEQVGAGSVVAACAWEMLQERLAQEASVRVRESALEPTAAEARVRAAFAPLDPGGKIVDECWRDYSRKWARVADAVPTVNALVADWGQHADELSSLVRPSRQVAAGLSAAGTPVRLSDLGADVDPATARWAVESCALMRDRFTVVDLLTVLGWWEQDDVDELLVRVDTAIDSVGAVR